MKLQDYLRYYLLCKMIRSSHWEPQNEPYILTFENIKEAVEFGDRPILRRLEDMPEKEGVEMFGVDRYWDIVCMQGSWDLFSSKEFHYLLTQHFDLFGLIDAGLAIDAKTVKP